VGLWLLAAGILAGGALVALAAWRLNRTSDSSPASQAGHSADSAADGSRGGRDNQYRAQQPDDTQQEKQPRPVFPPPPLRRDFDVRVELFDYRNGNLIDSRPGKDGERLLTQGQCVLRVRSTEKARVGIFSVSASGTIYRLFPNDFETDNELKANESREIPAPHLRRKYAIALDPSTGPEQVRLLATTGDWPNLQGHKEGPFMAFRAAELGALRDMRVEPQVLFAEVMVPFFVEKAPATSGNP
jgi:hypothetical protein